MRYLKWAILAAVVIVAVLYAGKAWAAYVKPQAPLITSDPALEKAVWAQASAYGESIPLSR
jgi:hypothetical protein